VRNVVPAPWCVFARRPPPGSADCLPIAEPPRRHIGERMPEDTAVTKSSWSGRSLDAMVGITLLAATALFTYRLVVPPPGPLVPPPPLAAGSLLPDVAVRDLDNLNLPVRTLRAVLSEGGSTCRVLVFFSSTCPACHSLAPYWRDSTTVKLANGRATVSWIAGDPADTAGSAFLSKFQLGSGYQLSVPGERRKLGIIAWPTAYLVSRSGIFLQELPLFPSEIAMVGNSSCPDGE
jgi:hypothetical protein